MFCLLYGILRLIFHRSSRNNAKESNAWKHRKRTKTKHAKDKGCGFPVLWFVANRFPYFPQINNKA